MKFSIVTATFNSRKFIEQHIQSVEVQTFHDFEHVFIDAFSNDGTFELLEAYQKRKPEHVHIYRVAPKGISHAMNEGISKAKGEYVLHLHSDDSLYNPDVLKKIGSFLDSAPEWDWVYGRIRVVEEDGSPIGFFPNKQFFKQSSDNRISRYFLKFYNFVPHQAVFVKRSIFEHFGNFDESLASSMDIDLWHRLRAKTRWTYVDEVLTNYRIHTEARSSKKENKHLNDECHKRVQRRYLLPYERLIALCINFFVNIKNKNYR